MGKLSIKLRSIEGGGIALWCPGCNSMHWVRAGQVHIPGKQWGWNADVLRPTFIPSIKVTYNGKDAGIDGAPPAVCHTIITDGVIDFLPDCTHELAGQKVNIPDYPEDED